MKIAPVMNRLKIDIFLFVSKIINDFFCFVYFANWLYPIIYLDNNNYKLVGMFSFNKEINENVGNIKLKQ